MNASEIIAELQRLIQIHGDVPVKALMQMESGARLQGKPYDVQYSSSELNAGPCIKIKCSP